MGLSALIRGHQTPQQQLRKITEFDGVLILACTLAVHCGNSSSFSHGNLVHTPSAGIQWGGRVGLSSVPHGKLVAYKSYIYVIKIFNFIALQ